MKNPILVVALYAMISGLAACGGGSGGDAPVVDNGAVGNGGNGGNAGGNTGGTGGNTVTTFEVRSYVQFADICADANANIVCDSGEVVAQTDENGMATISSDYKDNDLLLVSKVGSYDLINSASVRIGLTLGAKGQAEFINPLTTLELLTSIPLAEMAVIWQLDSALVTSDFNSMTVTGDLLQQKYVLEAISDLVLRQIDTGIDMSDFVTKIGIALVDVHTAMSDGVSMADLVFDVTPDQYIVSNLTKDLIERIDLNSLAGEWTFYRFGLENISFRNPDEYGFLDIDPSALTNRACYWAAKLNDSEPPSKTRNRKCDFVFEQSGGLASYTKNYHLIYGHTNSDGKTALLFKMTEFVQGVAKDDGFMWIDNYNVEPTAGVSLVPEQWASQAFSMWGMSDAGVVESSVFTFTGANVKVEYLDRVVEGAASLVKRNAPYGNGITLGNVAVNYIDSADSSSHMVGVVRADDYLALGIVKHEEKFSFALLSPNQKIIDGVVDGSQVVGSLISFRAF